MKILNVDYKWSILYDPRNNDRPVNWLRYGEAHYPWDGSNATTALFYALLEAKNNAAK